jgi:uncharacterized protein YjiS (DUF1127 family)
MHFWTKNNPHLEVFAVPGLHDAKSKVDCGRRYDTMTLLSQYSGQSGTSEVLKCVSSAGRWFSWQLNEWVAAFLAHREHQATLAVLHSLGDRELKDMGLHRGQIGPALEEAAKYRASRQNPSP